MSGWLNSGYSRRISYRDQQIALCEQFLPVFDLIKHPCHMKDVWFHIYWDETITYERFRGMCLCLKNGNAFVQDDDWD